MDTPGGKVFAVSRAIPRKSCNERSGRRSGAEGWMGTTASGPWKEAMKNGDMPGDSRVDGAGTALEAGACFEVRVEPIWLAYREREPDLGFFERRRARRRVREIVRSANDWLSATRVAPGSWHRPEGERVAHLRVARMGLVRLLKRHVEASAQPGALGACRHLAALRDRGCLVLPPDFRLPFPLSPGRKDPPLWVLSAPRLRAELTGLKDVLRVGDSPGLPEQLDFVDAKEEEIRAREARGDTDDAFWARFTAALLVKAVDRSVSHELPAIIP